jgi:hypothetical protein
MTSGVIVAVQSTLQVTSLLFIVNRGIIFVNVLSITVLTVVSGFSIDTVKSEEFIGVLNVVLKLKV